VANDAELSTQVVDPYESSEAIDVPSGTWQGPRPARPTLPLVEAIRGYLEYVLPTWEDADLSPLQDAPVDVADIALDAALAALRRLDDEASRARIPEKRAAFSALGADHAQRLAVLVEQIQQGRFQGASAFEWSDRIDALLEVAT
jgi:hypothetical protein